MSSHDGKVPAASALIEEHEGITYRYYVDERDLHVVKDLFSKELSEPYQIWTYRYFVDPWPTLTIFAEHNGEIVACCMASMEIGSRTKGKDPSGSPGISKRGYIGMISVVDAFKRRKIGLHLYQLVLQEMTKFGVEVITLETESDNVGALRFYEHLGFAKTRLFPNYYMNGKSAYRMKKWLVPNVD